MLDICVDELQIRFCRENDEMFVRSLGICSITRTNVFRGFIGESIINMLQKFKSRERHLTADQLRSFACLRSTSQILMDLKVWDTYHSPTLLPPRLRQHLQTQPPTPIPLINPCTIAPAPPPPTTLQSSPTTHACFSCPHSHPHALLHTFTLQTGTPHCLLHPTICLSFSPYRSFHSHSQIDTFHCHYSTPHRTQPSSLS